MLELTKKSDSEFTLTFDIQPLANKMGITKTKCAELIADEFMKFLFPKENK